MKNIIFIIAGMYLSVVSISLKNIWLVPIAAIGGMIIGWNLVDFFINLKKKRKEG